MVCQTFLPIKDGADFETEFTDESFKNLKEELSKLDSRVFTEENSYWNILLQDFIWERNEERNQET